jgi:hypothetical protein
MKRPYLVSFQAILSDELLSIRASVTDASTPVNDQGEQVHSSPIESIALITGNEYRLKIVGLDENHQEIFVREYDSDSFGNFEIKISSVHAGKSITALQVFETSYYPGLQILLGTFLPFVIQNPKKIIISDFDKTLCDTKFSTAKEVYNSLRKPLTYFPTVKKSVEILKNYTETGHQTFILSASPHFYERSIRDWLYLNHIYAGNIFLKDYRNVFSLSEGVLTPKDLKNQGFYKLNQMVNILLMTGIPKDLVLMGDGFESDIFIYSTLAAILQDRIDPWKVWNMVKKEKAFRLTNKQTSLFLSKFYLLGEMRKNHSNLKMKIYIRCTSDNIESLKHKHYKISFVEAHARTIEYYVA